MEKENEQCSSPNTGRKFSRPSRTYSKDSVISRRSSKRVLPENFFEKVLDLELKIKREFQMDTLQELVNLYTNSIEYYESIEDPQFIDYQNRLNVLLSQPDILKKMNEHYIKRASGDLESNLSNPFKLRQEQEKKQIKLKVNYISQITNFMSNNDKVQKLMDSILRQNTKQEEDDARSVVDDEINKQQDTFKSRLEERKKRSLFAPSNKSIEIIPRKKPSFFINDGSGIRLPVLPNEESSTNIKSLFMHDDVSELESIVSAKTKKTERSNEIVFHNDNNIVNEDVNENVIENNNENNNYHNIIFDNSFDKYENVKIEEIDDLFSANINENTISGNIMDQSQSQLNRTFDSNKRLKVMSSNSIVKLNESVSFFYLIFSSRNLSISAQNKSKCL